MLEVVAQANIEGKEYYELSNGQLLRKDDEGNIIERNRSESREEAEFIIFDVTQIAACGKTL